MSKRKYLPFWMRRRLSCSECGFIFDMNDPKTYEYEQYFNCPQCGFRWSEEEFWEENQDKNSYKMMENFD